MSNNTDILISVILGVALAFVFHRICKDRKCIVIRGPSVEEISSKTHQIEDDCFKYKAQPVPCPEDKKHIEKSV